MDWAAFIQAHNLEHSVSRRGNCHENAVAESFFSSLKRERIRRRTYKTREEARQDVFDYIEMFYDPVRKHVRNGMLSPAHFERQQILKAEGVQKSRGHSKSGYVGSLLNGSIFTKSMAVYVPPLGMFFRRMNMTSDSAKSASSYSAFAWNPLKSLTIRRSTIRSIGLADINRQHQRADCGCWGFRFPPILAPYRQHGGGTSGGMPYSTPIYFR